MSDRDDRNAEAYGIPESREPVGPGVRRSVPQRLAHHIPVRFPDETISLVRTFADEDGLTVSAWIRKIVGEEVERRTKAASATESSPGIMDLLEALKFSVQPETETGERVTPSPLGRNLTQLAS